jgi:CheY-like chemotaxis protein
MVRVRKAGKPNQLLLCASKRCLAPTHYKNCPTCVGFGLLRLTDDRTVIALADEAVAGRPEPVGAIALACPACQSTLAGIPSPAHDLAPAAGRVDAQGTGRDASALPARPRVLVVEDSPDDRDLFATYLAAHGFHVTAVENGEDALPAAFSSPRPDAILLDLVLGRSDGLAIAQALRADTRTASVPIVAITAAVLHYLPEVVKAVGCSEFLAKPCLPGEVARTLRAAIARLPPPPA